MKAIREYLEKNEISPSELARRMGVPPSTVWRHLQESKEKGRSLSWAMVKKYAQQGIRVEDMMAEDEQAQ